MYKAIFNAITLKIFDGKYVQVAIKLAFTYRFVQ